jgi:hypothetical protein
MSREIVDWYVCSREPHADGCGQTMWMAMVDVQHEMSLRCVAGMYQLRTQQGRGTDR